MKQITILTIILLSQIVFAIPENTIPLISNYYTEDFKKLATIITTENRSYVELNSELFQIAAVQLNDIVICGQDVKPCEYNEVTLAQHKLGLKDIIFVTMKTADHSPHIPLVLIFEKGKGMAFGEHIFLDRSTELDY